MNALYMPFLYDHLFNHFDVWIADKIEKEWREMIGWSFQFVFNSNLNGKLIYKEAKKVNYMIFYKIVYNVPPIPPFTATTEQKK